MAVGARWKVRVDLLRHLLARDVTSKYRGSALGVAWSIVTPVLMLAIYTFVFGVVFKSRWNVGDVGAGDYALTMYVGLMLYGIFADAVLRSSAIIVQNANYVKKVVFPLGIFPAMLVASATVTSLIGLAVWLAFSLAIKGAPPSTALLYPVVLTPLLVMTLGLSLFFAAASVYFRDLSQALAILVPAVMFLSPIFYPRSALPDWAQDRLPLFNPVAIPIEQARAVLIDGVAPAWPALGGYMAAACLVCVFGAWSFSQMRRGFADVL